MEPFKVNDTIAAVSTPPGVGGIAVIRVSGPRAIEAVNSAWKGADLNSVSSHTAHLGRYYNLTGDFLDEGVSLVFKGPASFTGEDVVEISVHGSAWIQREVLKDLVKRGVRIAEPGEFTQRAFLNGKIDLAQAEGVADLIASSSKAAHDMAVNQTRGSFSKEFNDLRDKLIEFASLLELELDFSEEDVEFADRSALSSLLENILSKVDKLATSYSSGKVLKNGVPVVIAGVPNAGKSSLLNLLLGDEKAIVTEIPGTTRDIIEDTIEIEGVLYRFIDTAGIRETDDIVEGIGVGRAKANMEKAHIVIWVIDTTAPLKIQIEELENFKKKNPGKPVICLLNKSDLVEGITKFNDDIKSLPSSVEESIKFFQEGNPLRSLSSETQINFTENSNLNLIPFSTKTSTGLSDLLSILYSLSTAGRNLEQDIIVTNARHYDALTKASESLNRALTSLSPDSSLPSDLVAQDIREAVSHLSAITGAISNDDLLHSIFSRFCIGK